MRDYTLVKLFKIEYHLPHYLVKMIRDGGIYINGQPLTDINKFSYRIDEEGNGRLNYIELKSHESCITIDGERV